MPLDSLRPSLGAVKQLLTVKSKPVPNKEPVTVSVYDDSVAGYLGVPISWGRQNYPESTVDRTSLGAPFVAPQRPDPNSPYAANGQGQFMDDLVNTARIEGTFLAIAPTGSGKTVAALNMAAELGRSTLVLVHLERLLEQWREEAIDKLGLAISDVGIVRQNKCQYDKKLVIAMSPSVARREYPAEFYDAFGTVIWDEVHRVAAPMLSQTIGKFSARYKVGLTATPNRKDNLEFVFQSQFGSGSVTTTAPALRARVTIIPYRSKSKVWGNDHGSKMLCLSRDKLRNNFLVQNILSMYRAGRKVLIIGDRTKHLQELRKLVVQCDVPELDTGLYVNKIYIDDKKTVSVLKSYLDWVRDNPALVFATYGMLKEAIDFPRLDAGIDVTPRADAVQVLGRIRRPVPGKPMPEWVTLHDLDSSLQGYYYGRMRDYERANVEINYKGVR